MEVSPPNLAKPEPNRMLGYQRSAISCQPEFRNPDCRHLIADSHENIEKYSAKSGKE
jgi:hypothetical protein